MLSFLYSPTLIAIHNYWKNHSFEYMDLCQQIKPLLLNMLSRFLIAFLARNRHCIISWLQSSSGVILEPKKIKFVTVSIVSPLYCVMKWWDQKVLHSLGQQIWKTQQSPQDWKRSVFIPITKKGSAKTFQTTTQLHSSLANNAENSPSKASKVCEPRTSRGSRWI